MWHNQKTKKRLIKDTIKKKKKSASIEMANLCATGRGKILIRHAHTWPIDDKVNLNLQ